MEVKEKELILSDSIAVRWDAIDTLKVLNQKVLVTLKNDLTLEITGLPRDEIDALFIAYSEHFMS